MTGEAELTTRTVVTGPYINRNKREQSVFLASLAGL
jgi:hypothetical protein